MLINEEKLIVVADRYVSNFSHNVQNVPYKRKGILKSEGFFLYCLCKYYGIEILIESGIANGRSTELFLSSDIAPSIHSIDLKIHKDVIKMVENDSKGILNICEEDSCVIIPWLITKKENLHKRIGIFIDGPKGDKACKMAEKYFRFSNVCFVAIHDQCKWHNNHMMNKWFNDVLYSDFNVFRSLFGYELDANDITYLSFLDNIKNIQDTGFVVGVAGK